MKHFWLALTVVGTVVPYAFFIPWALEHDFDIPLLFVQNTETLGGRFFTADLILTGLALIIYVLARERHRHVPYYGLSLLGTLLVGISCGLPLYFYLEERERLRSTR